MECNNDNNDNTERDTHTERERDEHKFTISQTGRWRRTVAIKRGRCAVLHSCSSGWFGRSLRRVVAIVQQS